MVVEGSPLIVRIILSGSGEGLKAETRSWAGLPVAERKTRMASNERILMFNEIFLYNNGNRPAVANISNYFYAMLLP